MQSQPPNLSACGSSLGLLFRQVRDALRAAMEHELAVNGHDITLSQYITLKKLHYGTANASELAQAAELNPGAMTRLLDRLETAGLVQREAHPSDRRALRIVLTERGRSIWPELEACTDRVRERALAGLDDGQRAELVRMLEHVLANLPGNERQP
ncbi:MAG TPA: MarR family transcriptional regulator [Lysobacter sp.]|jgi:DNA-binding MarR family transcriptional regulator|nr:MarR family transcriptional regulator [Lysobacter sp.]